MVYLTKDIQNRQDDKSPNIYHFLPYIWLKFERVFVAPIDIGAPFW